MTGVLFRGTLLILLLPCLSIYLATVAAGTANRHHTRELPRLNPWHDEGGTLWPAELLDSFECEACELVMEEVIELVNANRSMGETRFHYEMDEACLRNFEPWLAGYCMYPLDQDALNLYQAVVLRNATKVVCTDMGYCSSKERPGIETVTRNGQKSTSRPRLKSTLQSTISATPVDEGFTFAVLSDIHINDHTPLTKSAISKINSLISKENIKFAIITGDITNSAMPQQWSEAKTILDSPRFLMCPFWAITTCGVTTPPTNSPTRLETPSSPARLVPSSTAPLPSRRRASFTTTKPASIRTRTSSPGSKTGNCVTGALS